MKRIDVAIRAIIGIMAICAPLLMQAVTKEEMEQARTIAAKAYIRYSNDGSGYLDDLNPKTMEELEASLKPKEKENIKAFKAISVPSDYKDWDKAKLVEYWAVTAFQNPGLQEKGRGGRIRARSQINKMTVSAPQASAPDAVKEGEKAASAEGNFEPVLNPEVVSDSLKAEEKVLEQKLTDLDEQEVEVDKARNYTWVYIMVLAILVAVVIALVVYASNVMKKNGAAREAYRNREDDEANDRIEHLESLVSERNVEISMLNKKLESANRQNVELKKELEAVKSELAFVKSQEGSRVHEAKREGEPVEVKAPLRSIFLGRANAKGIFVRADRTLNVGNSVYVLETTDGYSGTFKVADSPAAWSLALSNPREYLETACSGRDLEDTGDASKIVTESSGTAVFEGGCWRVIRKARIRYE